MSISKICAKLRRGGGALRTSLIRLFLSLGFFFVAIRDFSNILLCSVAGSIGALFFTTSITSLVDLLEVRDDD
jgi:hypothetical protein